MFSIFELLKYCFVNVYIYNTVRRLYFPWNVFNEKFCLAGVRSYTWRIATHIDYTPMTTLLYTNSIGFLLKRIIIYNCMIFGV